MSLMRSSISCGFELLGLSWSLSSFLFMLINNYIIILFCFIIVKFDFLIGISELRPSSKL